MTRAEVLAVCPELDRAVFTSARGNWNVRVADAREPDLPGSTGVDIAIDYRGPENGSRQFHLDRDNVNDAYVRQVLSDFFGLNPLPTGVHFL